MAVFLRFRPRVHAWSFVLSLPIRLASDLASALQASRRTSSA